MELKEQLYSICRDKVSVRIRTLQQMIRDTQLASNAETKSSAGDKFETTRAMLQIEKDKSTLQLAYALEEKQLLDQININQPFNEIKAGALITTNTGTYFLANSIGKLEFNDDTVYVISTASPIGKQMIGKKKGDQFEWKGKTFKILNVE